MSSQVSLSAVAEELDSLTDGERAALRTSRFHSAPEPPPDRRCRLAHPGGALATNKAAALAKFLKRKLEQDGASSLDPTLVERAVENAKATVHPGASARANVRVRHVDSFSDSDEGEVLKRKKLKENCGEGGPRKKTNKGKKNLHNFSNVGNGKGVKVETNKKGKKNKT